uniref:Uncharacterized protein n=1 Tax=Caenorhabditis japonica TaxID=281687 RepID=A0A8R1E4D9_CAEJA
MYQPYRTTARNVFEFFVYFILSVFGLWVVPALVINVPNQAQAKLEIITVSFGFFLFVIIIPVKLQDEEFYPDCLMESSVAVISAVNSYLGDWISLLIVLNYLLIGILLLISARLAFAIMAQKSATSSELTRRMHKKFNTRTLLQAFVHIFFSCIPFTVLYITVFFKIYINGISFVIDLLSENYPTACVVTLFLYYDPYQQFLLSLLRCNKRVEPRSSVITTTVEFRKKEKVNW